MTELHYIDSHTGGEPTRIVVSDVPDLSGLTAVQALVELRENYDHIRSGCILEPRGSDVLDGEWKDYEASVLPDSVSRLKVRFLGDDFAENASR